MESLLFWIILSVLIFSACSQRRQRPHTTSIPEDDSNGDWWDDFFEFRKPDQNDER